MFLIALLITAKMDNKPNIHQHQNGLKNYGFKQLINLENVGIQHFINSTSIYLVPVMYQKVGK